MLFCKDHRDGIPTGGKPHEIMQVLAQRWKDLPDREKTKYMKKAAVEASRYEGDMAKFREAHPDLYPQKKALVLLILYLAEI